MRNTLKMMLQAFSGVMTSYFDTQKKVEDTEAIQKATLLSRKT